MNTKNQKRQLPIYFIGSLIIIVLGVINTKVLSNLFTIDDFGSINLILSTVAIFVLLAKGGLHQAYLRLNIDYEGTDKVKFVSTYFFSTIFFSLFSLLLFIIFNIFVFNTYYLDYGINIIIVSAILIIFSSLLDLYVIQYRISGNPNIYIITNISKKIVPIFGAFILYLFDILTVTNIFIIILILEMTMVLVLTRKNKDLDSISPLYSSYPILKEGLIYGLPVTGVLLCSSLLSVVDRYFIDFYIDTEAVGLYTAAYVIGSLIQAALITPLNLYIVPIYVKKWKENGEDSVKKYIETIIQYYYLISIPIIVGVTSTSEFLILTFTSEDFISSSSLISYISFGILFYGLYILISSVLVLAKKTTTLLIGFIFAVVINIVLNIYFIPLYGIKGAALTTLFSYIILFFTTYVSSKRILNINILNKSLITSTLGSLIMYLAIYNLESPIIKIIMGVVTYFLFIIIFEAKIRNAFKKLFK